MNVVPERRSVSVRGQPAGFWHVPGPQGAEPPPRVLLVHGLGASNHIWEPLSRALPEGVELYAIDLPGSGATPSHGVLGPAELAAFVLEWLEVVGVPAFDVVAGHSLGGSVALELALAAPSRFGSLMIFNAAPVLPLWTRVSLRAPGVRKLMELPGFVPSAPGPTRFFTQLYLWAIFGERSGVTPEVVEGYAKLAGEPDYYKNMAATLAGFARHHRGLADLEGIAMPASIVWGARDPLFPFSLGERLARHLPNAALHRLPRVGHCPPQEVPATVATLLMELVARASRATTQNRRATHAHERL